MRHNKIAIKIFVLTVAVSIVSGWNLSEAAQTNADSSKETTVKSNGKKYNCLNICGDYSGDAFNECMIKCKGESQKDPEAGKGETDSSLTGYLKSLEKEICSGKNPLPILFSRSYFEFYARMALDDPTNSVGKDIKEGYVLANNMFYETLIKLANLPYGLWMVAHSVEHEIETRTEKYRKAVPQLPDKAAGQILGIADMILYASIHEDRNENGKSTFRHVLHTKPSKYFEAGDKSGVLPAVIDLEYQKFSDAYVKGIALQISKEKAAAK